MLHWTVVLPQRLVVEALLMFVLGCTSLESCSHQSSVWLEQAPAHWHAQASAYLHELRRVRHGFEPKTQVFAALASTAEAFATVCECVDDDADFDSSLGVRI
jgi:hypothetical protein